LFLCVSILTQRNKVCKVSQRLILKKAEEV
jgi:hypothetical protein